MSRNELQRHTRRNGLGAAIARSQEQRAPTPAPSPQPSQAEALQAQLNNLTQQVLGIAQNMASQQRGNQGNQWYGGDSQQQGDGNQYGGPDPTRFDFFDEQDTADFHRLNSDHIEQTVQERVQAELAAREKAAEIDNWRKQVDDTQAKYGRDANFAEVMQATIDIVAKSGGKTTVQEAYLQASNAIEARSGRRGTSYMPKELKGLGAIMKYNQQTGRAGRTNKKRARW
jgi:hypothetical protein